MLKLFIHTDAEDDLDGLWKTDPRSAARITVFLQELRGNEDLLDRLTCHDWGEKGVDPFNSQMWWTQQKRGRNLWRLKLWELELEGKQYRIVYAFVPQKGHHYVLGILPRKNGDFNYEDGDPRTQRILNAYRNL